jgi:DNA-binding NtrC family response regulator
LLQRESFNGVLTDLKMAKLGGMELLQAIKPTYPRLPVVMMTGYPSVEIAVEAMKEGAADFITKPLRLDELLTRASRSSVGEVVVHSQA